jgi:hypothetical protein
VQLLGVRAYARHRGISHPAVLRALRRGHITATNGKIDADLADRQWEERTDPSKRHHTGNGKPNANGRWANQHARSGASAVSEVEARAGQDGPSGGTYSAARAAREAYMARLAKLEYESAIAKLVDADAVRRRWFESARRVRDAVMSVADRVSPLVTGLSDVAEVHRVITEELRVALAALALNE